MTETVKISSGNQITLSDDALAKLGVKAGDQVDIISTQDGALEIRPKRRTFADLRGIVKLEKPVTDEELKHWIDDARAAGYRDAE